MISRAAAVRLGLAQLISWGISYYLIGGFAEPMATDLGYGHNVIYGGFSVALLVMGITSPIAGRMIDQYGGGPMMAVGSVLNAAACTGLALCRTLPVYFSAWVLLGLAMRLTLYDAAFAALARIGGPEARRPMSHITLLGGLASTIFWPLGHLLAERLGWRGALLIYAGFALTTLPLHLALPIGRYGGVRVSPLAPDRPVLAPGGRKMMLAASLYALIAMLTNFLNAGMSAHMIGILSGLGLGASTAVGIATLRGIGQSSARLGEVLFGRQIDPLTLNLTACALLPTSFVCGLFGSQFEAAGCLFAFLYGAGNGITTITRGTLPLVLFDHSTYGAFVGRLIAPSFLLSAAAPVVYASLIARFGYASTLIASIAIAVVILSAAGLLKAKFTQTPP